MSDDSEMCTCKPGEEFIVVFPGNDERKSAVCMNCGKAANTNEKAPEIKKL